MAKEPNGVLSWNIDDLVNALKINSEDVKKYFTDGRRISFLLEHRVAKEIIKGTRSESEGAGYDVIDSNNGKWEVRSITKGGVYFNPSKQVGYGRKFEEEGFLNKLNEIEGYIVVDIEKFPDAPCWIIKKEEIKKWWAEGKLGTTTKVSRNKILELIKTTNGNR